MSVYRHSVEALWRSINSWWSNSETSIARTPTVENRDTTRSVPLNDHTEDNQQMSNLLILLVLQAVQVFLKTPAQAASFKTELISLRDDINLLFPGA